MGLGGCLIIMLILRTYAIFDFVFKKISDLTTKITNTF